MNAHATPPATRSLLEWSGTWLTARVAIVTLYLVSAAAHVTGFRGAIAEQVGYGMPAPALMAALTVVVEIVGSLLILAGRWVWLGAGMLGVFTALGAVLAHPFWTMQGGPRFEALATFLEHTGLVGGLILVALVAERAHNESLAHVR